MKLDEEAFYKMAIHSLRASIRNVGKLETLRRIKIYTPESERLKPIFEQAVKEVFGGKND